MREKQFEENTSSSQESLDKKARAAVEEARMVTPGIQALFGFQLIAAFNTRFGDLPLFEQRLHFLALALVALSVALIMAPAAYHRIAEQGSVSAFFVRFASLLIAVAMIPLMIAICVDVFIIGDLILNSPWISLAASLGLFTVFGTLWFVLPLAWRKQNSS